MLNKLDQKTKIYLLIFVSVMLLLIVGLSFAFFMITPGIGEGSEIQIETESVNELIFTKGTDISLIANLTNFNESKGNLFAETTANVRFNAAEGTTENYNASINLTTNDYIYTTPTNEPEIILTITNPEGVIITSVTGLEEATVTDRITNQTVTGLDITNKTGIYDIITDYEIVSGSGDTAFHEWDVKITFVNLDSDQTANEGKVLNGIFTLGN